MVFGMFLVHMKHPRIYYIYPHMYCFIYTVINIYIIKSNDSKENLSDKRDNLKTIYMKKAEMYVLKLSICSSSHAVPKQMLFTHK